VVFTEDDDLKSGKRFLEAGVQIAAGVPLQCDEGPDFKTFRIGLFGLDKLKDVDQAVARFESVLEAVGL
jgi:aspartate aminotransferase-like enzyme